MKTTKLKLFECEASAFNDEGLVDMPGFSHRSQPYDVKVTWYPFSEWRVKVWLYARHRSHACRQLTRAGVHARDLDGGYTVQTPPQSVLAAFTV